MPRDRFVQIKRYLHFSDDIGDKLHKVRFILDNCREKFQREYKPNRKLVWTKQ